MKKLLKYKIEISVILMTSGIHSVVLAILGDNLILFFTGGALFVLWIYLMFGVKKKMEDHKNSNEELLKKLHKRPYKGLPWGFFVYDKELDMYRPEKQDLK